MVNFVRRVVDVDVAARLDFVTTKTAREAAAAAAVVVVVTVVVLVVVVLAITVVVAAAALLLFVCPHIVDCMLSSVCVCVFV